MSITLENGRINLDSLVTIEDRLRGLALANRTLDSIKDQMSQRSDKKSDWYRRLQLRTNHGSGLATNLRTTGYFAPSGKDVNRLRWQYENEALMAQLKSQVSKGFSVSVCAGQKLKLNSDWSKKTFVLR
jgi:hypothetical protein